MARVKCQGEYLRRLDRRIVSRVSMVSRGCASVLGKRTPIMRNAALGAHVMKGEEKKWHEGRGVPSRLPVESQRL